MEDLQKWGGLKGNFDPDNVKHHIKSVQDVEVQAVLGTELFEKIDGLIQAGTLAGNYLTLVTEYVQAMLIHYTISDLIMFHGYEITNAGVLRNNPEDTALPSQEEIMFLSTKKRTIGDRYRDRLIAHLCYYSTLYPEYHTDQEDGEYPNSNSSFSGGWNLD